MLNYLDNEKDVIKETSARHNADLEIIYSALGYIKRGIDECPHILEENKADKDRKYVTLGLAAMSHNSLRTAVLMLEMGYYQHGIALVRIAEEAHLLAEDIQINPRTLSVLLNEKGKTNYSKIVGRVSTKPDFNMKKLWHGSYSLLSEYGAHPRFASIIEMFEVGPQGEAILSVEPAYKETNANALIGFIGVWCRLTFRRTIPLAITASEESVETTTEQFQESTWFDEMPSMDEKLRDLCERKSSWAIENTSKYAYQNNTDIDENE